MHVVEDKVRSLFPVDTKPKASPSINAFCAEFAFVFDGLAGEIASLDTLHEGSKLLLVSILPKHYNTRPRNPVVAADNTDTVSGRNAGNITFAVEPPAWQFINCRTIEAKVNRTLQNTIV
jgi:hypothetical protein